MHGAGSLGDPSKIAQRQLREEEVGRGERNQIRVVVVELHQQ
jgi:hypothetical protein